MDQKDEWVRNVLRFEIQSGRPLQDDDTPPAQLAEGHDALPTNKGLDDRVFLGDGSGIRLSTVKVAQASILWRQSWTQAQQQMEALSGAIIDVMISDPLVDPDNYDEIEANVREMSKVTTAVNLGLADEIDRLRNAKADQFGKALESLRKQVADYENFLSSDEWAVLLDDNEFLKVSIQSSLLQAAAQIRDALQPI